MNTHIPRRAALVSLAGVPLGLGGCGGGGDGAPPGRIGAAGGSIDGPAATRLSVPAGALAQETVLSIAAGGTGAPALPAGFVPQGGMFAFTPHGTRFAVPVTVTLPYDAANAPPGSVPALFKTDAQGQWVMVPGATVQGPSVVAQVDSFSWFNLGQLPPAISTQPADATVTAPATASFGVVATGSGPLTYQWQRSADGGASWSNVVGATLAAYTTGPTSSSAAAAGGDDGALLRVIIGSAAGSSTSRAALLKVSTAASIQGMRIAAGSGFSLAILASGEVRSWGAAGDALGYPAQVNDRPLHGPVAIPTGAAAVSAGTAHSMALMANDTVWAFGYNGFGQLSISTFDPLPKGLPAPASAWHPLAGVACGSTHTLFLAADGTVWASGRNQLGQLGDGTFDDRQASKKVQGLSSIVAIAAGGDHSLALRSDGTVWAWGENTNGQLGDGTTTHRSTPVQVQGLGQVMRIAAGFGHSLALVRENPGDGFGPLWGWGLNDRGQLGTSVQRPQLLHAEPTHRAPLADIACGTRHSVLLFFDGTVFCCGDNVRGQLGDPSYLVDYADAPRFVARLPGGGAKAVAAGGGFGHTLAHLNDGSVWAWGDNQHGQLGRGTLGDFSATPQAVSGLILN